MTKIFHYKVVNCDCGKGEFVVSFYTNKKRIQISPYKVVGKNCIECGVQKIKI